MKRIYTCEDLLSLMPEEVLESLEEDTSVNHHVKKLKGKLLFELLLFSILETERISLRVIEEFYNSDKFKIFTRKGNDRTRHSSLRDRISTINPQYFKLIFEYLYEKFSREVKEVEAISILRVDSTLVGLTAKLMDAGMTLKDNHFKRFKFTVGMRGTFPRGVKIFTTQKYASEEIALREAILEYGDRDSVVVFDRGLQSRASYGEFNDAGIKFVTRLKSRLRYKKIKVFKQIKGRRIDNLILQEDIIVVLKDQYEKWTKKEYRLITGISEDGGSEISFLTNILDLRAKEIADIYKKRWDIEVFFRFLKQELNFRHLVSRNSNAVEVMTYMALIAAILIIVYKKKNKLKGYKIPKLRLSLELEVLIARKLTFLYERSEFNLDTS